MSNKSALQVGQSLLWRSRANESEKVVEGQMSNRSALQVSQSLLLISSFSKSDEYVN